MIWYVQLSKNFSRLLPRFCLPKMVFVGMIFVLHTKGKNYEYC